MINSVLMGVYNFRATISILPQEVIKELERMYRNYLWGANETYKKVPYVSWEDTCKPKKYGGAGIRNMDAWNKVCIAKLV